MYQFKYFFYVEFINNFQKCNTSTKKITITLRRMKCLSILSINLSLISVNVFQPKCISVVNCVLSFSSSLLFNTKNDYQYSLAIGTQCGIKLWEERKNSGTIVNVQQHGRPKHLALLILLPENLKLYFDSKRTFWVNHHQYNKEKFCHMPNMQCHDV